MALSFSFIMKANRFNFISAINPICCTKNHDPSASDGMASRFFLTTYSGIARKEENIDSGPADWHATSGNTIMFEDPQVEPTIKTPLLAP